MASSISVADLTTVVEARWIIVTSAPCAQRSAQISWAEVPDPSTMQRLPAQSAPLTNRLEWYWTPVKLSAPGIVGRRGVLNAPPVANTSCLGFNTTGSPARSTITRHSWVVSS